MKRGPSIYAVRCMVGQLSKTHPVKQSSGVKPQTEMIYQSKFEGHHSQRINPDRPQTSQGTTWLISGVSARHKGAGLNPTLELSGLQHTCAHQGTGLSSRQAELRGGYRRYIRTNSVSSALICCTELMNGIIQCFELLTASITSCVFA